MPAAQLSALDRGVYVAHYRFAGRPVLIAVGSNGELLAHRVVPAEWPIERAIGALLAWLDAKDPPPTLRLVSDAPEPVRARRTTHPVVPSELCVSRAQYEILHGWKWRGGKPPQHRAR